MLKLVGSLSASFRPTGDKHISSEEFAKDSIARRIGRAWHLFKKAASKTPAPAPAPFVSPFVLDEAFQNFPPALENDNNHSNLSISEWNLRASESLTVLHDSSLAALEQPASTFARTDPMAELPADFWKDLPDMEFTRGPVSVEPIAFARRSVPAQRADEPAASLH